MGRTKLALNLVRKSEHPATFAAFVSVSCSCHKSFLKIVALLGLNHSKLCRYKFVRLLCNKFIVIATLQLTPLVSRPP